jgi:hypothetical protein
VESAGDFLQFQVSFHGRELLKERGTGRFAFQVPGSLTEQKCAEEIDTSSKLLRESCLLLAVHIGGNC